MIRKTILFLIISMCFFQKALSAEKVWQAQNLGISDINMRSISVFPKDDSLIIAACAKSVYFSENEGRRWEKIFSLKTTGGEINFVTFDYLNSQLLYLGTSQGLFIRKNKNQNWQKIFNKVNEEAKKVKWITLDPKNKQRIYLGTGNGLYVSEDSGSTWERGNGGLSQSEVRSIAIHPFNSQVLYLANTYGLFKTIDGGQIWARIYVTSYKVSSDESEDDNVKEDNDETVEENQNLINCVVVDQHNAKKIFMATGDGVFVSHDAGESWNEFPSQGLGNSSVNFIAVSSEKEDMLYAATQDGVFEFLPEAHRWQKNYQGMTARDVRTLVLNKDERYLWAGTDRGIFRTVEKSNKLVPEACESIKVLAEVKEDEAVDIKQLLDEISLREPSIQEIQEAALRYAEVIHPEKIKTLRRNARLKALLPDITLGYDKTVSVSTNPNYKERIVGPRDWGLSFSWDVGDLIFSEQIRLIDSNARLQIQLRDDILNEVTRLYYERRKLETELILTPPETTEERLTKTLRLEELTANIDALTGNYFSRKLKIREMWRGNYE